MVRYPHKAVIKWNSKPTKGANGSYQPGAENTQEVDCRAEPGGEGVEIRGADGAMVRVSFAVYMAKQSFVAPIGSMVEIFDGDEVIFSGQLLRMANRQTHSRLWL